MIKIRKLSNKNTTGISPANIKKKNKIKNTATIYQFRYRGTNF